MEYKFRTLRVDEIELRVGVQTETGASLLLYKDSRCDMNILDEAVGPTNWQRRHARENANCIVSIWDDRKEQWIDKEDTGTESKTEAEKGLASDSFKRACVNWGIGRELYTAPFIWCKMADLPQRTRKGKVEIDAGSLSVSAVEYNEARRISMLEITNENTGEVVFRFPKARRNNATVTKSDKVPPPSPVDRRGMFNELQARYGIDTESVLWAINQAVSTGVVEGIQGDVGSMSDSDFVRVCAGAEIILKEKAS